MAQDTARNCLRAGGAQVRTTLSPYYVQDEGAVLYFKTTEENREAVLQAVRTLASKRELPTMRVLCRMTGIRSTSTVSQHLQRLEALGHLVSYRCERGAFYLPAA